MNKFSAVVILATASLAAPDRSATAESITALTTTNQIFSFDSSTPGSVSPFVSVTGLSPATLLYDIDFRPASGLLTAFGRDLRFRGGGFVFTVDPLTGAASRALSMPGPLDLAFDADFNIDFNPVADALRVVSSTGQNLRITAGGTGVVNVDGALNPALQGTGVAGAAYSNNVPGGSGGATTLYDLNADLDALFTQGSLNFPTGGAVSPNTGTLFQVGSLGVDTGRLVGFDISGLSGVAFASLTPVGSAGSSLYTIDLSTGTAALVGAIGGGDVSVRGLTVQPAQAVPEPGTFSLLVVGFLALIRRSRRQWPLLADAAVTATAEHAVLGKNPWAKRILGETLRSQHTHTYSANPSTRNAPTSRVKRGSTVASPTCCIVDIPEMPLGPHVLARPQSCLR
jgi:Domain of unknown function (DUF4394)